MKYDDSRLIKQWALLMLQIAIEKTARSPLKPTDAPPDRLLERVDATNVTRSRGYRALRRWFSSLSRGAKARARTWMTTQLVGVARMKAAIEKQGDVFSYADLNFDIRAATTGELISGPTAFEPETATEEHDHGNPDDTDTNHRNAE